MRTWFKLMGVNALLFGVTLLVVPEAFVAALGGQLATTTAAGVARLLAAQTIGYGLLSLAAARLEHLETRLVILAVFLAVDGVGTALSLWAVLAGGFDARGSIIVVAHAVASAGWAWFLRAQLRERELRAQAG